MQKKIKALIACLILACLYNNCTGGIDARTGANINATKLVTASPGNALIASSLPALGADGGNGQHYDGKIRPGRYVRQVVGNFCGDKNLRTVGEIIVTETDATGKFIDPVSCQSSNVNIDLAEFEYSQFQEGRVGLIEGIYSLQEATQSVAGTDEVWCRKEGSSSTVGYDIVIKVDPKGKSYTALRASATQDASGQIVRKEFAPLRVERRFEDMDRVRYRASGFELEIRRRDYNSRTGLMEGEFVFTSEGIIDDMKINCRLGGELDVMMPKH